MVLEEFLSGKDPGLLFGGPLLYYARPPAYISNPRNAEPVAQVDRSSGKDPEPPALQTIDALLLIV
jgi:hypothetical protein